MTNAVRANRVAAASLVGTTLEYYEFFSYTVAAVLVFPKLMFPDQLPATATLLAFASIGVAFVARPFGALLFGHFGDRWGRRPMLFASLVMMGAATTLIGVLPGHDTWSWAPVLLVALRLVQGLAVAGENTGSSLLAIEHAPPGRRGLFSGFTGTGSAIGILLANGMFFAVSSSLSDEQFLSWGWRIPFLASSVLLVFGLWVRLRIPETPVYRAKPESSRVPLWTVVRSSPRVTLLMVGAMVFGNVLYYTVQTFVVAHGTSLGIPRNTLLAATTVAALLQAVANLAWCWLSDRTGRRPLLIAGAVLGGLWMFPLLMLVNTRQPALIIAGFAVAMILFAMHAAPQAAYSANVYASKVRFTALAFTSNAGGLLGGALAPITADRLATLTGTIWWVPTAVLAVAILSSACLRTLPELHQDTPAQTQPHPATR